LTPAKVFQEYSYIISSNIDITVKVTVAGYAVGTWVEKRASPEINQECIDIYCIHVAVTVKVSFTFTGIANAVPARW
jgi:hypothetical protein